MRRPPLKIKPLQDVIHCSCGYNGVECTQSKNTVKKLEKQGFKKKLCKLTRTIFFVRINFTNCNNSGSHE